MRERKLRARFRTLVISVMLLPVIACADKTMDVDVPKSPVQVEQVVKATPKTEGVNSVQAAQQNAAIEPVALHGEQQQAETPKNEPVNTQSSSAFFEKDLHYVELFAPVPVSTAEGEVEVVEMFWYGCPHCFTLDPHLDKWRETAANDVKIVKIPGILNPAWKLHSRAFYAAQVMGVTEKFHQPLFQTIHQQGRKIKNQDALIRFVESQGIDGNAFLEAMNSMSVTAKVARAEQLSREYGITGVPALMVGGKYRVLGGSVSGYAEMFEVVDFLAEKIRQEQ